MIINWIYGYTIIRTKLSLLIQGNFINIIRKRNFIFLLLVVT